MNGGSQNNQETQPLLAPTAIRPGISRTSSTGSNASGRGILRRIFIDRASSPSQHLSRPTFPPPSASTYSPLPPAPLTLFSKINLFINQAISVILSTYFLVFVVGWAVTAELVKALPKWLRPVKAKQFPWDNDTYWRKEGKKVSKNPRDYAKQVGMDIEDQTVETEDGYLLK
jgi:lysosomal acid lipase/cholesteryl ester hydrolase